MIGERLRKIRKKARMTQVELADLLGTKKSAISLYENDKSTPNDRYKVIMAKRLNISLDYLLGIIDEPVPYYKESGMLLLPENMGEKKIEILKKFSTFLERTEM